MSTIETRNLDKSYGTFRAVSAFSHSFREGEITTIVGPSGSGKSTTLWLIAGLTRPDGGRILIDGADVTDRAAEHRDVGMVFQSYALFPHLSVRENVEFGLRVRGIAKDERRRRAHEVLELVHMERSAQRRIQKLSGGEQQRVALARALAFRPRILLMDEPLSALDAKLREELRDELLRLLNELKLTTIYVTHDQSEAMLSAADASVLQCSSCRMVTSKGVYVCPILIDSPDARMGDTIESTLRPFPLAHGACHTCWVDGVSCRT